MAVIDSKGYRANVGIVLSNRDGQVFWARRAGMNAWQFPQGGIGPNETPETAMYRELQEEIGLSTEHVELIGTTRGWLRYRLPRRYIRYNSRPLCIGQKQIWYLLRLIVDDSNVQLDQSQFPEFDSWRWISYWDPIQEVVAFKRSVYRRALQKFAPLILPEGSVEQDDFMP